jgi:hypothetical protein
MRKCRDMPEIGMARRRHLNKQRDIVLHSRDKRAIKPGEIAQIMCELPNGKKLQQRTQDFHGLARE